MKNSMTLAPDAELRQICREIVERGWTKVEWSVRECDDWVDHDRYRGGFEAATGTFCFETTIEGVEYRFRFGLSVAKRIAAGERVELDLGRAD